MACKHGETSCVCTQCDLETIWLHTTVTLPLNFVSTKYPGYFWHLAETKLYSIKIDGILKPMKLVYPNHFNRINDKGYRVSVQGKRKFLSLTYLKGLVPAASEIPIRR